MKEIVFKVNPKLQGEPKLWWVSERGRWGEVTVNGSWQWE